MDKKPLSGFQRHNPEIVDQKYGRADRYHPTLVFDEEGQHKLMLAEKLCRGEKMTKTEKRQIYKYLTGNDAPQGNKKGRHTQIYQRDIALAWDYLVARAKGIKKAGDVRKELAIQYNITGQSDVRDDTFYKAFNNGLAVLESSATEWMLSVKSGDHDEMAPQKRKRETAKARLCLALIKKYKKVK